MVSSVLGSQGRAPSMQAGAVVDDLDLDFEQGHWPELAQICSSPTIQHFSVASVQLDHLILGVQA
jgi:hypothetical protein